MGRVNQAGKVERRWMMLVEADPMRSPRVRLRIVGALLRQLDGFYCTTQH